MRKAFLRAYPICQDGSGCFERATDVDHIDGLGPLGPRGHDWSNLRALCHSHHSKRTARDQPGGWNFGAKSTQPFIVLIGESGVGKSTIGARVSAKLNSQRLSSDDFDYGWRDLYAALDRIDYAVVECVRIPVSLANRMEDREATLVELTLNDQLRYERLRAREVDQSDVDILMNVRPGKNAYRRYIEPEISLDTSENPDEIAQQIVDHVTKPGLD